MMPRPQWRSEHIPADDPFARFAAMAQKILVKRVIAANRAHWRKSNERQNQKRHALALQRLKLPMCGNTGAAVEAPAC